MSGMMEILACLAEVYLVVRLCNHFLGFRDRRLHMLKSAGFFLVLAVEDLIGSQWECVFHISDLLFLVLIGIYVFLFMDGRLYEKILITIFPAITILPINLIILNIVRTLSGEFATDMIRPGGQLRILILLFSKVAFFLVCEFMIYMRKGRWSELNGFRWGIQIACFVITFLMAWILFTIPVEDDRIPEFLLLSIMVAVLNILLYISLDRMQHDAAFREEHRLSEVSLAAQEERVAETREQYAKMRTLRHDMRHYLTTAAGLLSEGKTEAARAYIENVLDEQIERTAAGIDTGHVVVDAVINHQIAVCQRKRIAMKCMIDSGSWAVTDTDMSVLLSNLLDNAISGCSDDKNPWIELRIGTKKTFTYVIVKNSIAASVLGNNPGLRTDKEDRSKHGFGILSIQSVAKKYGGSVEFSEEKNTFIAEVWLEDAVCRL